MDTKNKLVDYFSNFEDSLNGEKKTFLHKKRIEAIEIFDHLGFPTQKHEEWKYTNLNFLRKFDFELSINENSSGITKSFIHENLLPNLNENLLVFINGFFSKEFSQLKSYSDKLILTNLQDAVSKHSKLFNDHFSKYTNSEIDTFSALNTAYTQDGAFIYIPDNYELDEPIHFMYINNSTDKSYISNPRNLIIGGENSKFKFFESIHSLGDNPGLTNLVTEIYLSRNSRVDQCRIQNDNDNCYFIGSTDVYQESSSMFHNSTISLNGKFLRNNLNVKLAGEHSEANFHGLYFINNDNLVDNHTFVDHAVPNCLSNESFKGILDDKSTAVFSGKILVRQDAQKTNAYQSNKNILLSDTATINTKPQLEIYADDVKCSHGATTGSLDDDMFYYLRSRGINLELAKSLLLTAFVDDISDKIEISEIRDDVKKIVAKRLGLIEHLTEYE